MAVGELAKHRFARAVRPLPTPAIAELDRERPLRIFKLGDLAAAMQRASSTSPLRP